MIYDNELKKLNIPDIVKDEVNNLCLVRPSKDSHFMGTLRQRLFTYILYTYIRLNIKYDIEKLKDEFIKNIGVVNVNLSICHISGNYFNKN
jgi:hypothetical protein